MFIVLDPAMNMKHCFLLLVEASMCNVLLYTGKTVVSEGMEMPPLASEKQALKSNAENLDHELIPRDQNAISDVLENKQRGDVLENKQRGTKRRKQMVKNTIAEDYSKCVLERNELPIDTEEVIGIYISVDCI